MKDQFYAVFVRLPKDDWGQKETLQEAEKSAMDYARCNPQNQYFVMKTIVKFAAVNPEPKIERTEIEHEH